MASLDELLADAKAKERELENKKTALKNASRFTGSRFDKFRKNPENKSQVDKLRATQEAAQKKLRQQMLLFRLPKN